MLTIVHKSEGTVLRFNLCLSELPVLLLVLLASMHGPFVSLLITITS